MKNFYLSDISVAINICAVDEFFVCFFDRWGPCRSLSECKPMMFGEVRMHASDVHVVFVEVSVCL